MANPTLKTKMGNNQNHKQTKYNENKWLTEVGSYFPKGGHSATQTELKV